GAGDDELLDPVQTRLLEHVHAHLQIRVPVAAGVGAVGTDPADLGREVEDELRLGFGKQTLGVGLVRQVVGGAPRDEDVGAAGGQQLEEVRSEEATAAGDEDAAHAFAGPGGAKGATDLRPGVEGLAGGASSFGWSQSTRPIQRSRFSAYHRIVSRTPFSQLTLGSQPVSRFSFS